MKYFTNNVSRLLVSAIAVLALSGMASARHDEGCVADATTLEQLKAARQATASFNSIQASQRADYEDIGLHIGNMGHHWVNWGLVDGLFEPDKPEAMVYADLGNGQLKLVAVEYLAPYVPGNPPSGFAGTCDQWSPFPADADEPLFWTLHAWIWEPNLAGTFAKFNPMVP